MNTYGAPEEFVNPVTLNTVMLFGVSACVRPETIQIALSNSKDSETRNRLDAEVQNVTDLGEIREIHLKVGRWKLRTRVTTTSKLVAGQTIVIDIDPKGCTIVTS